MTRWLSVLKVSDVPPREGRKVICGDREIAVFNLDGSFVAIDNRCPHRQGPLADGIVAGGAVTCPLHNLTLNLKDGCALRGGEGKVSVYPVKVTKNTVCIALEPA